MRLGTVFRSSLFGAMLCGANCFTAALVLGADLPNAAVSPSFIATLPKTQNSELQLLGLVKAANEDLFSSLQSFVCSEQMDRFKGSLAGDNPRHIDTLTTKVSFENGTEHYSEILQDKQPRKRISSVPGAWSEGEFGTLLQQTRILLSTQPVVFVRDSDPEGAPAAIYVVEIDAQNSPWDLEVDRHHYRIPFRTQVWVSRATGQIVQIERVSTTIPSRAGISEIRWGVTLQTVKLDEKNWLLPRTGSYAVLYKASSRREWNELTFSNYHRYGSEAALRFQ